MVQKANLVLESGQARRKLLHIVVKVECNLAESIVLNYKGNSSLSLNPLADKALHLTAFPLRSKTAGELYR